MKYTTYTMLLLTCLLALGACNKKLDVLPQNNITPDQVTSESDVSALIGGTYSLMQSASAFGEQYIFIADLLAAEDQVDFVGTFTNYKEIANKQQTVNTSIATTIWSNSYQIISNANTVLDKMDLVSDDNKDEYTGEAEFMRGVAYFMLVNYFAKPYSAGNTGSNAGVPLILAPVYAYDSTKDKPARATVDAVYQQIIADLTDAGEKLYETNGSYATLYSAKGFLVRVYMMMGDYQKAAETADEIIQSQNYSLITPFENEFNNTDVTSEDIFGILQTNQSNAGTSNGGLTTFYRYTYDADGNNAGGRGDAQINENYFSYFGNTDDRADFYSEGSSISGIPGFYTNKWLEFYKVIPVIRLAEMYLSRGEANLLKGGAPVGGVTPLQDINTVRTRAKAGKLTSVDEMSFVDERFRELGFEGDRLWTLKRNKMDVDGYAYDADELVLPIPQREIDVNSNLEQNPGY